LGPANRGIGATGSVRHKAVSGAKNQFVISLTILVWQRTKL
jgi:hypothetical protein